MLSMWLQQQHACDLIFWGPGFTGYRPGPLDQAAEALDCDAVLLPDLHHAIPGLWDDLWVGAEHCRVPVVMFLSDPGSAVGPRIAAIRRTRPSLLLTLGPVEAYSHYDAVRAEVGARILQRPLGFDPDLFYEPSNEVGRLRDIDILVVGAADADAYVTRRRIQAVCRELAPTRQVMDLTHPGYWEISGKTLFNASRVFDPSVIRAWFRLFRTGGISLRESFHRYRVHRAKEIQRSRMCRYLLPAPEAHGQVAFSSLLRRSKLVVTGTTFGIVAEKYYEAAACGAIGIGDLPPQPGADDVRSAMLVISPDEDELTIRQRIESLLDNDPAQIEYRNAARRLAKKASHLARAQDVVAALVGSLGYIEREHRPLPFRQISFEREYVGVVLQTDGSNPSSRTGWHDLWDHSIAGRELRSVLTQSMKPLAAIALSGEAALPPDVHFLAETASRYSPKLAVRPAESTKTRIGGSSDLAEYGWCLLVVDREALLHALNVRKVISAVDVLLAILFYADQHGAMLLEGPGFDEPTSYALRVTATGRFRQPGRSPRK